MKRLIQLFTTSSRPKPLKEFLGMQFPNDLIACDMPNVGSYHPPVKVKAVNKFKAKKHDLRPH